MNKKEEAVFHLNTLTEQARRKTVDRRGFMKGAMALGLSATSALLLFQACGGDEATAVPPTATTAAPVTGGEATVAPASTTAPGTTMAPEVTEAPTLAPVVDTPDYLDSLVRRLPELDTFPVPNWQYWPSPIGKTFVYLANDMAHPWSTGSSDVFRTEAEGESRNPRLGMDLTVLDSAMDPAKEADNFEQAITGGFDVIIVHPLAAASGSASIKRARQGDQIVIGWTDNTLAHPTARWTVNTYQQGLLAGQWMGQQLPAGSKVAGAVGELISQTGQARKEGFLEGASQAGLEVLAFEEGTGWTQDGGYTMGQSILSSFPDLQGIFGGDDLGALGVHDAAVEAGRRDGLLIAGVDGLQKGRDGVADGSLDMSVMLIGGHREAAIGVIDMLEALVRGDTHGDAMDAMHFIKSLVVTKESLAEPWGVLI